MADFVPLPKLLSAKQIAEIMFSQVFRLHGLPQDLVSDRGPQFVSVFWKEFCRQMGATASLSSGFRPQSNGQTEHYNQEMETGLRCMASQYAHNSLPVSAIGLSPFQCVYGYLPLLFPDLEGEVAVPSAQAQVRQCHPT